MVEGKAPHLLWQPVARQNDNSVELMCFLGASPQPAIKWYYGNRELKPDSRFQFKFDSIGKDLYLATLQIKDIVDSDAGCYRCVSVNPHGRGQANLNLKFRDSSSPSFVEKPHIFSRDDGRVIVMEFRVKSILNPTFVWRKGDEIVAQSERINIVVREEADQTYYAALEIKKPTKEKDAGRFTCTIENDSGKLTAGFTVKFEVPQGAPSFTRKSQIFEVTSDSGDPTMVFDVGYKADRNPEVTWIDPKGEKMKESSRIRFFTTPDGPNNCFTAKLELKNYKAEDSGTYTCNIKNEAGEATAELSLNIQGLMYDETDEGIEAYRMYLEASKFIMLKRNYK